MIMPAQTLTSPFSAAVEPRPWMASHTKADNRHPHQDCFLIERKRAARVTIEIASRIPPDQVGSPTATATYSLISGSPKTSPAASTTCKVQAAPANSATRSYLRKHLTSQKQSESETWKQPVWFTHIDCHDDAEYGSDRGDKDEAVNAGLRPLHRLRSLLRAVQPFDEGRQLQR